MHKWTEPIANGDLAALNAVYAPRWWQRRAVRWAGYALLFVTVFIWRVT